MPLQFKSQVKARGVFMKKKLSIILCLCVFAFLFTSCDEVLSVVTLDEDGNKVINQYVLMFEEKFYDETVSLKTWQENFFTDELDIEMDELIFKIEDKKENLVVFGDTEAAVEMSFFEGGYNLKLFYSLDDL